MSEQTDEQDEQAVPVDHYRALLDSLPFPAWLKDTESRFVAVNEVFARIFGAADTDSLIGKTDFDIAPHDLAESYRADDRQVLASLQKKAVEEEIITDGERRWFETYKAPVIDGRGALLGTVGLARDITESKLADQQAKEQLARFQSRDDALAAISQGVVITGIDRQITYANNGFEAISGYTKAEVTGRNCNFLQGPDTSPETEARISRALIAGEPFHGEILNYRKDGTPFWNGLSIVPVVNEGGAITQFVGVMRNITTRKQIEDELADYARRTEALSRRLVAAQEEMRRRLSAELHDRTSPNLAAIAINLRLLANELDATEQATSIARLEDTSALIEDTAASIREISTDLRPPLLDYLGLLPALESYAMQFSRRTGIPVRIDSSDTPLKLAPATESVMFRIAQEALTNCAKHAAATAIEVSLLVDPSHIRLAIIDNGAGFDPLTLGDVRPTSGIGLINMKEMAEFVGATFSISSQPGVGTRVCFGIRAALGKDRP